MQVGFGCFGRSCNLSCVCCAGFATEMYEIPGLFSIAAMDAAHAFFLSWVGVEAGFVQCHDVVPHVH